MQKEANPKKVLLLFMMKMLTNKIPRVQSWKKLLLFSQPKEGGDQDDHEGDCVKESPDSVHCSEVNDLEGNPKVVDEGEGILC